MYDTILLPTDGSDNAELASDRAIAVADTFGATLHVLYVVERTRDDPETKGIEEKVSEELNRGREVVEGVEKRAANGEVETTTTVEPGVPRSTIADYAEEHGIDLIVIGSTGADDPTDKLLGTVSKFVVNEAPADVLTVRPDESLSGPD
ncbi:universal stress protein [Halalkalicoccus tibetensis]|uniref:Universal stress protein n=1 Tax=Halalkalicoccus tibetensis TaxID=175632 RepID=A0ABD5V3Y3_9EURY